MTATGIAASTPATNLLRMCDFRFPMPRIRRQSGGAPKLPAATPRSRAPGDLGDEERADAAGRCQRGGDLAGADDVHGADARAERRERLLQLGDHPALDRAVGDRGARLGDGQPREARRRIVLVAPHAADGRAGDQRRRAERRRQLVGDDVGVDVQRLAAARRRRGRRPPAGSRRPRARRAARRSNPSTSPTRPRSTGAPPPPEITAAGAGGRARRRSTVQADRRRRRPRAAPRTGRR